MSELRDNIDILFEQCRSGDLKAQEKVYKHFYPELIKICVRYSGNLDDAGTIYNNAFLKIFNHSTLYEHRGRLTHWVIKVITHTAIDYTRAKHKLNLKTQYHSEVEDLEVSPSVLNKLSAEDIYKFIQSLPKATAIVFNMFIYENYLHKEIAHILKISEGTSKWHVNEARRLLRERFESSKSKTIYENYK